MWYTLFLVKRWLEHVVVSPLIALGYIYGSFTGFTQRYNRVLFFPFYHTGGAEAVHAQIARVWGGNKTLVVFTKQSTDDRYFNDFIASGSTILCIEKYTGSKWLYPLNIFYRGVCAARIAQCKPSFVFNGQCNFAYKLSPWLPKHIPQIELIHSFNSFSWIRVPYLSYYAETILIAQVAIDKHVQQYNRLGIPTKYTKMLRFISNGVAVPASPPVKPTGEPFTVLWVGRHSEEKRLELFEQLAALCTHLPIKFICIGVEKPATNNVRYLAPISDASQLNHYYTNAHAICITSRTEGFPMVVMEATACGCLVIATPVGDLPNRLGNQPFAHICSSIEPNICLPEMVQQLTNWLTAKPTLAIQAHAYAVANFSLATFESNYTQLASTYEKN